MVKILQCHTKGDKRYSPFCCYVEVCNYNDSIENHYQCAKRFENGFIPKNWKDAKLQNKLGVKRTHFELRNGLILPPDTKLVTDLAVQFYILMWYKYLRQHPELIEYASEFDEFNDIFKGAFPFCQADVIEKSVKDGVESLKDMCSEFIVLFRNHNLKS